MAISFVSAGIWPRLRRLAKAPGRRAYAAVPFIGPGALKRLPLQRGDVLVTRFDKTAVRAGHVDPREIVAFIKRGVEVHSVANLHAKVYVFGRTAFVGSANVSSLSENHLIEAGCEVTTATIVAECRAFVLSLRGEIVESEFARRLIPLWRPPQILFQMPREGSARAVRQSDLVAVSLDEIAYDEADQSVANRARRSAAKQIDNPDRFRLDDFRWHGSLPKALRPGSRVLMCTKRRGNVTEVTAPARVLEIRRYKGSRGGARAIVVVELRKYLRGKLKSTVLKALGPDAKPLRSIRAATVLRDPAVVYKLGQLWPASGSTASRR